MLPPSDAARAVAETIARVRMEMNTNPEVVHHAFTDVAAALPGDRRMLQLAADVVSKSSNPKSILYALAALNDLSADAGRDYRAASAETFRVAIHSRNAEVRRYGAYYLAQLAPAYKPEAYRAFRRQLGQTPDSLPIYQLMAPVFADSPDVLYFFASRLRSAHDAKTAQEALSQLSTITGYSRRNPEVIARVASEFDWALSHDSPAVQLNAAYYLLKLGGKHANSGRAFLERRLREPFGAAVESDEAKWIAVYRVLRPLLDNPTVANKRLLIDAASANSLIEFYEADVRSRVKDSLNQAYLTRWKELVSSERR